MVQSQRATRYPDLAFEIVEVQSNADGDGVYNCSRQALRNIEWVDTEGTDRFAAKNTTAIEVLNLLESKVDPDYTRALSSGDRLAAIQIEAAGPVAYIGGIARKDNVVTVTLSSVEGFVVNKRVVIDDVNDSSFDGSFVITTVGDFTITYEQTGEDGESYEGTATGPGTMRWVGFPMVATAGEATNGNHLAYCKTAAPASTNFGCFLGTDSTGDEITIKAKIAGGGFLNAAIPRLTDGLELSVWGGEIKSINITTIARSSNVVTVTTSGSLTDYAVDDTVTIANVNKILSINRNGNIVTVTLASVTGFSVGQTLIVTGVADSSFDGSFALTAVNSGAKTFIYSQGGDDAASSGGEAKITSTSFNGKFTITAVGSTTFTFVQTGSNASAGDGAATVNTNWHCATTFQATENCGCA